MTKAISLRKKKAIYEKTNGSCSYCGASISMDQMVADHVVARVSGGSNSIDNLLPSCRSCNSSKGSKTLEQFRRFYSLRVATGNTVFGQDQADYLFENGLYPAIGADMDHKFHFELLGGI